MKSQPSVMQIAGHTLSLIDAASRSARQSNPAASQSFMSFAALALKVIEVILLLLATGTRTISGTRSRGGAHRRADMRIEQKNGKNE